MFTICNADDAGGPWSIYERLRLSHDELGELNDMTDQGITLAFMFRGGEWRSGQRGILGKCYCGPSAQGDLRPLFEQLLEDTLGYYPDFLIILAADWWEDASEREREVLVFHELLHCGWARDKYGAPKVSRDSGMPATCIVPHSIEEFTAVVRRYGAWKADVAEFIAAATEAPAMGGSAATAAPEYRHEGVQPSGYEPPEDVF